MVGIFKQNYEGKNVLNYETITHTKLWGQKRPTTRAKKTTTAMTITKLLGPQTKMVGIFKPNYEGKNVLNYVTITHTKLWGQKRPTPRAKKTTAAMTVTHTKLWLWATMKTSYHAEGNRAYISSFQSCFLSKHGKTLSIFSGPSCFNPIILFVSSSKQVTIATYSFISNLFCNFIFVGSSNS